MNKNDTDKFKYLKENKVNNRKLVYVVDYNNFKIHELYLNEASKLIGLGVSAISNRLKDGKGFAIKNPKTNVIKYYVEDNWYDAWLDLP